MRNKKWMVYLGLLIVLGIGMSLVIKIRQGKSTDQVIKEIVPAYGNIQSFISTTGTVQPQNRLEIRPPIGGRIEDILIREGEKVKVGQTLAWMSSTERAALLDAAQAQDKEAVKYWQEAYKPTPLLAPIDGEVIVRAVEPGQTVTAFDPIIVLSDRLIVKAQVDETDIGRVKAGQTAIVSLDAYPQVKVKAKVDHISYESQIVNNVIIYEVDVLPDEVPEFFRSGMSANVDIIERSRENVLLVPIEAVKREKGGNFVLLSEGNEEDPVKRRVELGISDESRVEVISGLGAEDRILIMTKRYSPPQGTESGGSPFSPFGRRRR
jgi:macrolide-specific efflux system membrane fusion protein